MRWQDRYPIGTPVETVVARYEQEMWFRGHVVRKTRTGLPVVKAGGVELCMERAGEIRPAPAQPTRSPIATLIDSVVRCVKCGLPPGDPECRCWVTLKCTGCGKTTGDERIPEYYDFDVIETLCPECGKA